MNDDLISRSALKEEFAKHEDRKGYLIGDWEDIIDNAPPADIKPFALFSFDKDELERIVNERVIEPIKNGELVVKTKERPTGKWIVDEDAFSKDFRKCSNCNEDAEWLEGGCQFLPNYCPNCGACMMKEEENEC